MEEEKVKNIEAKEKKESEEKLTVLRRMFRQNAPYSELKNS